MSTFGIRISYQFTYLETNPLQDVYVRSCMLSLFIIIGGQGCRGSFSLYRALFAWRWGLLLTEVEMGVLSVCSLFLTRVVGNVRNKKWCTCVYMCVYAHTHALCTWGTQCEPRGRDRTPWGLKESRWTKSWHVCICICVQSTHVYIFAGRLNEILD